MTALDEDFRLLRGALSRGLCGCAYLTSAYPCGRCRQLEALRRIERALLDAEHAEQIHRVAFAELDREHRALRGLVGRMRAASFYAMSAAEWDAAIDRVLEETTA